MSIDGLVLSGGPGNGLGRAQTCYSRSTILRAEVSILREDPGPLLQVPSPSEGPWHKISVFFQNS
jgi:hypothetical protein